ncbi:MAG: hypothetical protein OER95_01650 [Acidimicrobiia bacterium]|nr:hypothetical protein [Acidimicrobiia bacterium]
MSRESAARTFLLESVPSDDTIDLESLNEGIALLARLEEMLVDMQLSLDRLSLARR